MSSKTLLAIAFVFVLLFGGWFFVTYNGLVSAQEGVDAQWSQVENQYQRRADLIPNLVETVKGIAAQEEKIFIDAMKYRSQWNAATTQEEKIAAAKGMDSINSSVLIRLEENYPQLKSNDNFLALQAQLEGTENRIAVERMRYKDKVEVYNTMIRKMPTSIIANMFGFKSKAYFEAARGAEEAPVVTFGTPAATSLAPGTTTPIPSASVELYGEKTDVDLGEDIILKLSAVNLITKPVMTVQVILFQLSGMSVTSSDFVTAGAGQYTSTYKLEPGGARDIEIRIKTNQVGDFTVKGRIIYYFGDNISTPEDHTLELHIKVRAKKIING
ncbi:MAG: LemA family protein [Candidatus Methanoperedens sp.]|nr:LemA family protein [Candidatus Methanoperedens sp.]